MNLIDRKRKRGQSAENAEPRIDKPSPEQVSPISAHSRERGESARTIEFTLGDTLLPCPVCGWVGDGLAESELWRHFANSHAAEVERARIEVEAIRSFEP